MSSHPALTLHRWEPCAPGAIDATVTLACGCVVSLRMPADRLLEVEGGEPRVVGKFPCPQRHPVRWPSDVPR